MDRQLTIKFVGKDAGLNRTASAAAGAVRGVGDALQQGTKATGAYVDAQGRVRNAQGQFIDTTKLTKKELTALRMELAATGQNVEAFDEQLKRSESGLKGLAATTGLLGGAIAGLFGRGTQEYLAFSGAIKQAGVVGGASAEELKILEEEVERLGIVTSKAPAEIAQTSVALSRAGFSAQETTDALEGVARASEATGESLFTVGDITAKTTRTFGLAADSAGKIGDILTATANNTNTTVTSIGESLAYVGAQAKAADQPVEDVAIAIGLLGDAGIQGSSAGTGLAAALDALKQASAGAKSEFTDLVRGNEKRVQAFDLIKTEVRNADGSMKSLIEILPVLKQNLGALSREDQDVVSKALFGVQGGRVIQTLLNTTDERLQKVTQTIRGAEGQATASGEAMLTGLGGALSLLQGSVGATQAKFGEFAAVGLEPVVRIATAVLNTFLSLPGPVQTLIVGTTALTGVLAAATAVLATYNALNVAKIAADTASAGATTAKAIAEGAATAVLVAATTANEVFTASLTKQNAMLAVNTVQKKAAAAASKLFAGSSIAAATAAGTGTVAFGGLGIAAAALAAKAALVFIAFKAVSEVFKRSEGAQFAKELSSSVDELEKARDKAEEAEKSVSDLRGAYSAFLDDVKNKGPIEAVQNQLAQLTNSTGRFGKQLGIVTREQRGNQIAQIATTEAIAALGGSVDSTSALLGKYGQTSKDALRELNPQQLAEFTAGVAEQSKALQEEIELLEGAKGESKELDEQLQNEINSRENLIRTLNARVAAQGGETAEVEAATDAARELSSVLDDLDGKYAQLNANAELTIDRAIADVATQEAQGLLSQAEAERKIVALERTALQAELDNNRALLRDLNAQRNERSGEDVAEIDARIFETQKAIAQNERQLATELAAERREQTAEAEKEAEAAAKRQQEIAEEAAKERADLLKQVQEDEKRSRAEAFSDTVREETDAFDAAESQRQDAFEQQRRSAEAAFSDAQRDAAATFSAGEREREEAFEQKLRAAEAAFSQQQREREEAFSQRQQEAARSFEQQQNAEREAAEGRFAERRQEIERSLQLEDAGSSAERRELEQRFAAEDAAAERRRAAFAELEAEEKAFEEQQRAEREAFEQQQRAEAQKFEQVLQQQKEAFEQTRRESEQLFEQTQQASRAEFEQQQRAEKVAFEDQQRQIEREFELEQQNREREFEAQQREAERAFNEEQRSLDRQNAQEIQSILDGATAAPSQSLRSGGVAEGGIVQVHADEFLVPPKGTRVVSQLESRRLVQEYLVQNPMARSPVPISQSGSFRAGAAESGVPEKLDTLIAAVRSQLRPTVKAGGDTYNISGEADPSSAAAKIALEQVRGLMKF